MHGTPGNRGRKTAQQERHETSLQFIYNSYKDLLQLDRQRGMMDTERIRYEQAIALAQRLTQWSIKEIEAFFNTCP